MALANRLTPFAAAFLLVTWIPRGAAQPAATVGWYNGDRQAGIPGYSNWYISNAQYARVYDDFVVPPGGWTVAGVFSNNSFYNAPPVIQACWEIRSGVGQGAPGNLIATGIGPATRTYNAASDTYRIQVDGLQVALAPGTYWLSVAPVGLSQGQSYVAATLGYNAVGTPPGNNGAAFSSSFAPITTRGSQGSSSDFSQGLLTSGPAPAALPNAQRWQADVSALASQMLVLHGMPLPGISQADFQAEAADLYNRIPTRSDAEIRTSLLKLVASIGDAHTDVTWPWPSPFRMLPLSFYWFDDGIFITGAAAEYQNLLGGNVLGVGEASIDDATRTLAALVPHENDQWPKKRIPQMELPNADFLFGTGLAASTGGASFRIQTGSGGFVSADIASFGSYDIPRLLPLPTAGLPLYLQHTDRNYWATLIDGGATLYFQYNSSMEDSKQPSAEFFAQLEQLMAGEGLQRIILDMRFNSGGFTSILAPWIEEIRNSRFNVHGRLFVIVGRATFSAAMEATNHLHDRTAAIFVGEPTGAKPRFQLRQGDFELPYFGIRVSYSNGIESANDPGPTMIPDIPAGLTFADYVNGVDPAMDAIEARFGRASRVHLPRR
ncbi:MAG: hypothetical protein LAQ30_04625 [Acidobacteriia bacterium]|nr:hypothetical protein [Terriglobia bacterium]